MTLQEIQSFTSAMGTLATIMGIIGLIDSAVKLFAFWDIMSHERGSDRVGWLLGIWMPILGSIAYLTLFKAEQEERAAKASLENTDQARAESLRWADEILARNGHKR